MARFQIDNVDYPINYQTADILQRTLQNAKNLLMCHMGEVPYDRYRGFDPALFDLPMDELNEELLPELDRVMEWDPDIEVEEAQASLLEDGSLYIRVIINIPFAGDNADDTE